MAAVLCSDPWPLLPAGTIAGTSSPVRVSPWLRFLVLGRRLTPRVRTDFELGTRVPLIIRAPFISASVGKHTRAFAELVDGEFQRLAFVTLQNASTQTPRWQSFLLSPSWPALPTRRTPWTASRSPQSSRTRV